MNPRSSCLSLSIDHDAGDICQGQEFISEIAALIGKAPVGRVDLDAPLSGEVMALGVSRYQTDRRASMALRAALTEK